MSEVRRKTNKFCFGRTLIKTLQNCNEHSFHFKKRKLQTRIFDGELSIHLWSDLDSCLKLCSQIAVPGHSYIHCKGVKVSLCLDAPSYPPTNTHTPSVCRPPHPQRNVRCVTSLVKRQTAYQRARTEQQSRNCAKFTYRDRCQEERAYLEAQGACSVTDLLVFAV